MKKYEKPMICVIALKTEERLAASPCTCSGAVTTTYGDISYTAICTPA